jgi:hypothetical protein
MAEGLFYFIVLMETKRTLSCSPFGFKSRIFIGRKRDRVLYNLTNFYTDTSKKFTYMGNLLDSLFY